MIFTVTWEQRAEDQLTRSWLRSADRNEVTAAAHRINLELRRDAHLKGAPVADLRSFAEDPLAVIYAVSVADRMVTVVWVQES